MVDASSTPQSSPPAGAAAPNPGPVIILIEDEPEIRRFLRASLLSHGYRLVEAGTAREGLEAAETRQPDLLILDLGLPDMDGLEVIRRLREWTQVPILVLSARGQEVDKVAALDAGADDYVSKPFGVGELLARVRVSLRRAERMGGSADEQTFATGDLQVDFAHRRVLVKEQDIHLTPIEYRLLTTLARHAGKVLTRNQLLKEVWGRPYTDQAHYLHVYMANLRRKIEDNPARPRYILTEPGVGYRLAAE
ncbi:MAG TPA: response regulator [Candidatus Methylomirabilis sp.]|nr:response regulator [Candidatus Methylomirabilis sp.]